MSGFPRTPLPPELAPGTLERILARLERQHGIGLRGETSLPGWQRARILRCLGRPELAPARERGGYDGAAEALLGNPELLGKLADDLRVGETRFFRDPLQWQGLEAWLRRWPEGRTLRALSAGCSTGEEAWSLAMCLRDANLTSRVFGLDRSSAALEVARAGNYSLDTLATLTSARRQRYVELTADGGRVSPSLGVTFLQRDLMQGPPAGTWDLIVCKNVLIYFGDAAGAAVAKQLVAALSDVGVLLVARSEAPRLRALGFDEVELGSGATAFR
ncbi:MAG: chemotaxis protein [Myxococcales bacterium]|nr:chemotaxis protein [Myxococcales bacterium]